MAKHMRIGDAEIKTDHIRNRKTGIIALTIEKNQCRLGNDFFKVEMAEHIPTSE